MSVDPSDHTLAPTSGLDEPASPVSRRIAWLVLGFITLLYVATCFTPVLFDDNEGLYAGAVREMHARGNWLVPTTNGFARVQKPPLVYWTMLVSTSLLGRNEFALRLPNALATAGWIVATYFLARRVGGERTGVAAAAVLASMLGVWVFTHLVQPEPFLACFVSLALLCLVEARARSERARWNRWYAGFWISLALGTMSKGLHGALWPLTVAGVMALTAPTWRPWLRPILHWRGPAVFLLIVTPWYAYMCARFPHFLWAHFVNEQLGASLNTRYPADAKQLSLWQFYGQHLIFWMPWTLFLPAALAVGLRVPRSGATGKDVTSGAQADGAKLLGIWIAVTLVTVAFSTRQDYYSMSCWGAVATFLAWAWTARSAGNISRPWTVVPLGLITLGGLAALGLGVWIALHQGQMGQAAAAPIAERDTFADALGGISPALWSRFAWLLAAFGVAMLSAGGWATWLAWRRSLFAALLGLAGAVAVPVVLAAIGFTMMSPFFSLAEDARAINGAEIPSGQKFVACEALPNTASSLFWYLDGRVHWVNAPFDNQYAQQVLGEGRDYYLDEPALLSAWAAQPHLFFIIEETRLPHWQALLPDARILHQSGTRLVLVHRS